MRIHNMAATFPVEARLGRVLAERASRGLLRSLTHTDGLVDFASNDYLGLARSPLLAAAAAALAQRPPPTTRYKEGRCGRWPDCGRARAAVAHGRDAAGTGTAHVRHGHIRARAC